MLAYKAAIFDLDGTLLDSMDVWAKTDKRFLAKRNIEVPEDYSKTVSAMSFKETVDYTISRFNIDEKPEALIDELNQLVINEYSHFVSLKQNAKEYLMILRCSGIKLAVATSLPALLYGPALKNNGIYSFFDVFCSVEDVTRSKEYPDIFLLAAEKLHMRPEDCLVYEDIYPAVRSAKQCGMKVIGVYDKHCEHFKDEIISISDGYIYDWKDAPLPSKE